jgi:hypothetical protein
MLPTMERVLDRNLAAGVVRALGLGSARRSARAASLV